MQTTIFHLTHFKAGSQWISEVLRQAAPSSKKFFRMDPADLLREIIQPNSIYAPAYLTRPDFLVWTGQRDISKMTAIQQEKYNEKIPAAIQKQNGDFITNPGHKTIKFYVIRDLRDSIISAYFSVRYSHVETDQINKRRSSLVDLSDQDGITYMIENVGRWYSKMQTSWLDSPDTPVFRYEDFIEDELKMFRLVVDHCEMNVSERNLRNIVAKNSFTNITGRKPGEEDKFSHLRSGTRNNWKEHFSSEHISLFKKLYGDVLIRTGYENDLEW